MIPSNDRRAAASATLIFTLAAVLVFSLPTIAAARQQGDDDEDDTAAPAAVAGQSWLGVGLEEAGEEQNGVRVSKVFEGSPAERAGLRVGDEIVALDGEDTSDAASLTRAVRDHQPGDRVTIRVRRDEEERSLQAVLSERSGERSRVVPRVEITPDMDKLGGEIEGQIERGLSGLDRLRVPGVWMGIAMQDLTPDLRRHFGAQEDTGVLIAQVKRDSPAERAGVKVGDVLTSVDGQDVGSPSDVASAISGKKPGEQAELKVLRDGRPRTLVVGLAERPGARQSFRMERIPGQKGAIIRERIREDVDRQSEELSRRIDALQAELDNLRAKLDQLSERMRERRSGSHDQGEDEESDNQ